MAISRLSRTLAIGIVTVSLLSASVAPAFGQTPQLSALPEVKVLLDAGRAAVNGGQLQTGLETINKALAMARELKDRKGEADALQIRANVWMRMNDAAKAFKDVDDAVPIYEALGDGMGKAKALNTRGVVALNGGRPWDAEKPLRDAIAILEPLNDITILGGAMVNLSNVLMAKNEFAEALDILQRSLPIIQKSGNRQFEGNNLNMTGLVLQTMRRREEAREVYFRARKIYEEIQFPDGLSGVEYNLGQIYWDEAEPTKAREHFQRAIELAGSNPDPSLKGRVLSAMGDIAASEGNYKLALENYEGARDAFRITGEPMMLGIVSENMGVVMIRSGLPAEALKYFEASLKIYRESKQDHYVGIALNMIGGAYLDLGQPEKALQYLNESTRMSMMTGGENRNVVSISNAGYAYLDLGDIKRAEESFNEGLRMALAIQDTRWIANMKSSLADICIRRGHYKQAIAYAKESVPTYRTAREMTGLVHALHLVCIAQSRQGLHAEASKGYDEILALTEKMRSSFGALGESKASFLRTQLPYYYGALQTNLDLKDDRKAFAVAQKTKARGLIDLMEHGKVNLFSSLTKAERQKLEELRLKADFLNQQMVKQGVNNEVGAKQRYAELSEQLATVEDQLQRQTEVYYARYPGLSTKTAAKTASLADLAKVVSKDTALIEYVVLSEQKAIAFVVTSRAGKPNVQSLALKGDYPTLVRRSRAFREACANPKKDFRKDALSLYQTLLAPLGKAIEGKKHLVVCPDGALWDVPFQALMPRKDTFIAAKFDVTYAYSATGALAAMSSKGHKAPREILAVANPSFGSSKRFGDLDEIPGQRPIEPPSRPIEPPSRPIEPPSRPIEPPSRSFGFLDRAGRILPLPGTQNEADLLNATFKGSTILTGVKAQESAAKKLAPDYRYLHFATHGLFNDASPWLSSIVLAQPSAGSKDDGFLTAREIFELNLKSEMVVLSACNTGRGIQRSGDGVIGLTWALFAAGCPTQIVSQWAVDDASTAKLMEFFYRNLKERRLAKGAALQQASKALMKTAKYKHPYYWAPFVLIGNWK